MIVEGVRKMLGDELAAKVDEALKGKGKDGKDLDLVVGNDGTFVPVEKHEGVKTQATAAEAAMKTAASVLKGLGGSGDPAKFAEDVANAKKKFDDAETTYKNDLATNRKTTALKLALSGQVHDASDIISRLDLAGIEVDDNGDLKTDIAPLLTPIRTSKPYLFTEQQDPEAAPDIKGAKPAEPGKPAEAGAQSGPTIF
ncbi:MAG: phage scaffolding protein [Oscillospiraceae bacterium]